MPPHPSWSASQHHESDVSITDSPQLPALLRRGRHLEHRNMDAASRPGLAGATADRVGLRTGVTVALQFLPFLLFGPWGGIAADRYSKRRLLAITQSTMGALALMLGVLVV